MNASSIDDGGHFGNKKQSYILEKISATWTYARTLFEFEYRMNRRYKKRYFAPDIQIREQQPLMQKK